MQTVYLTEIHSDDEEELEHNGEPVEKLEPIEVPVETLTAAQVAAAAQASKSAAAPSEAAEQAKQRGNAAFGAGRFDEAIVAYSEAITLWPEGAGLIFGNRSAAKLKLGRSDEAVSDAEQMASLLPDLPKAHFRLGGALAGAGRHVDAAGAFAEMLRLDPTSDIAEEQLRKEMASGNVKKNKKHAKVLQRCQEALAGRKAQDKSAKVATATAEAASKPPRGPPLRVQWAKPTVVAAKGAARPSKRAGATLSAMGGRLWLLGGADREQRVWGDVWEFALTKEQRRACAADGEGSEGGEAAAVASGWREHATGEAAALFTPRAAHAAVAVGADALIVHGGHNPHSSNLFGDLLEMRLAAAEGGEGGAAAPGAVVWRKPPTAGVAPEARNGHTLSCDGGAVPCVYLFGGADDEGHRNDLHVLQLGGDEWEWRNPLCTGAPPAAREMHAATVVGRALLVHGGRGGAEGGLLDDLGVLCLRTLAWSVAPTRLSRVGHAAVLLPSSPAAPSRMLALGGFDGGAMRLDAWQLAPPAAAAANTTTSNQDGATGAPPAANQEGAAAATDASPLASDMLVERGRSEGEPRGRFSHAACAMGGCVFIFGGSAREEEDAELVHAIVS